MRSRAKRFIDEPACSKPDQNIAAPRKSSAHRPIRFFSVASLADEQR